MSRDAPRAPIPAVAESDARGETAALFADIRSALGVPVVNLVWRHLATMPGALDWAWSAIGPLYRSGAAAREGGALLAALPLPARPAWSRDELRAAGVDEAAEREVVIVLDSYHRSNAMNLVALTTLRRALERPADARPAAVVAAGEPPTVEGRLPALLPLAEIAPATAALIHELDRFGERGAVRIPATMYRHLAHWPGFLGLARALVAPLDQDGRLNGLIERASAVAGTAAERLAGEIAAPPAPATRDGIHAALAAFTAGVIAKMVPICALLRRAMPA